MTQSAPGTPAPAVLRAAAVLRSIAEAQGEPATATEVARELDLPKSSTINILAALVDTGLARRVQGGYGLGPTLVDLASAFLRHEEPVQRFSGFVPTLRTASHETVQLATLEGDDVVYLARHDGSQPISLTSTVGRRLPAASTALGKAILGNLHRDQFDETVGDVELRQLTPKSHATRESLWADVQAGRTRGYAIDNEEAAANVVCLAVMVPGRIGQGAYAVSATLFKDRLTPELEESLVHDLTILARYLTIS